VLLPAAKERRCSGVRKAATKKVVADKTVAEKKKRGGDLGRIWP